MRCLHCGKRLSLLRKFSDGEFCSAEHRQIFQQQQSDLALARLLESQTRIEKPLARPEPKPAIRGRAAVVVDDDRPVPEAAMLVEWCKPAGRRQIVTPRLYALDPSIASEAPLCLLPLRGHGFPEPGGLAAILAVAPCARHTRRVVLNPLFRLGIRLPLSPGPVAPSLDLPWAAEAPLPAGSARAGTLLPQNGDAAPAEWPAEPLRPALAAATVAPERTEAAEPEPLPLVDQLLPLAMPEPGVAPSLPAGSAPPPMPVRRDPVRGLAPDRRPEHAGDEESAPLPMAETLCALAAPSVERGHALPVIAQAPPAEDWAAGWSESYPARRAEAATLALRDEQTLHPVAGPQAAAVPGALCVPDLTALPAQEGLRVPGSDGAPRRPAMRQVRRAARINLMAHAAAARIATAPIEVLPASADPGTPAGPRVCGGIAPVFQKRLRRLSDGAAQDAPRALVSTEHPFEIVDAAAAPCVPAGGFRPEAPIPVVVVPEEPEEVHTVRPLLAPDAELAAAPPPEESLDEPRPVESEEEFTPVPPLCRELRIFAGRGESGAGAVVRANESDDGLWMESLAQDPMRPQSRLVIDHADGSGARRAPISRPSRKGGSLRLDLAKLPGRRFWAHAPSDLKWVALALPVILGLVVYSFKASPPKSEAGRPVATSSRTHSVIGSELNSIQKVILERAAIKLYDDFRGGLGSWQGTDGWAKTWKYGEASFLEPGQLALYTPTVNMRDYTVQFLGQIERRSLNWVFRAVDSKNYYAMRIVIARTGPLPQANVVRYAVINGKETGARTLPLPFPVRSDTLYLVKMEVHGDSFVTYIQNQVVDNFSDSRLASGGVGFFSPKGDKSYLRWVEVTHQYDVLGRLCAFLAPYNVQAEGKKTE